MGNALHEGLAVSHPMFWVKIARAGFQTMQGERLEGLNHQGDISRRKRCFDKAGNNPKAWRIQLGM